MTQQTTKKVLITGVAGLIGAHFSRYLLDKGYTVIGIDDLSGGYRDFVDPRIIEQGLFYSININNQEALAEVFKKHTPDTVYHFAAYAAEGLSPFIRNFNYTNNLLGSINIINACINHGIKKIIFTSSMAVYGHGTPPFTESQTPTPADPYGIAKYTVEMDLAQAHEQFGLKYSIVRPHNVVGIYQNIWDKYRNVIGIWIRKILAGEPITVFGDGTQKRAFSDVAHFMEPFEKLMDGFDGETFNLGADTAYELKTVAEMLVTVAKEFGYDPRVVYLEERNEVKYAYSDHTKATKLLGFQDKTDIEKVVRDMFIWAKDQPSRAIKQMTYEVEKDMYSFWKKKIHLPNVTLIAVAGNKVTETIRAMQKSMKDIQYGAVVLCTHEDHDVSDLGIELHKIEKLDYKAYNHFIIYRLHEHVPTEYALVVQHDGYVLRPDKWDNRFFDYDYIGAPWKPNLHFTKSGKEVRVGNGGFSFRSKKLLTGVTEKEFPFTDNGTGFFHEDGVLCVYYRDELEQKGFKYAPVEIAARFSHEFDCPESVRAPFGFHNYKYTSHGRFVFRFKKYFKKYATKLLHLK